MLDDAFPPKDWIKPLEIIVLDFLANVEFERIVLEVPLPELNEAEFTEFNFESFLKIFIPNVDVSNGRILAWEEIPFKVKSPVLKLGLVIDLFWIKFWEKGMDWKIWFALISGIIKNIKNNLNAKPLFIFISSQPS